MRVIERPLKYPPVPPYILQVLAWRDAALKALDAAGCSAEATVPVAHDPQATDISPCAAAHALLSPTQSAAVEKSDNLVFVVHNTAIPSLLLSPAMMRANGAG